MSSLLLLSSLVGLSQPNYPTSPDEAQLIFEDVDRFTEAFNSLSKSSDTVSVLEEKYFVPGSVGLKEYMSRHGLSAEIMKILIFQ